MKRMAASFEKQIFEAARKGNLETLQDLVKSSQDAGRALNSIVASGRASLLHLAAENGHDHIVEWLLLGEGGRSLGFNNVLGVDCRGATALHVAARSGHLVCCKAIVNGCVVENGEREKMINAVDNDEKWTVLHYAVAHRHEPVVEWLLSNGEGGGRSLGFVNVFARSNVGGTAMHVAAYRGSLGPCIALVRGCKVEDGEREQMINSVDNNNWTALHHASLGDSSSILISWLLSSEEGGGRALGFESASVTALTKDSRSALHLAVQSNINNIQSLLCGCSAEERRKLFSSVDNRKWTVLHTAARSYYEPKAIGELMQYEETKMIADLRDYRGLTALHRAVLDWIDEETRVEWGVPMCEEEKRADRVRALLGGEGNGKAVARVDVNLGIKSE